MPSDLTICWLGFAVSAWAVLRTYHAERHLYGGLGLASLIAANIVLYNLVNPFFYLISPILAPNFTIYIGLFQPPSLLVPNILATTVFLVSMSQWTRFVHPVATSHRSLSLPPIPGSRLRMLLCLAFVLTMLGLVLFVGRNMVAFGSWSGSFSADYAGATARPHVPVLSTYIDCWAWAIEILTIVCLWQHAAGRAPRLVVLVPLLMGSLLAIAEGSRWLLGVAVLLTIGWYGLRARLSAKQVIGGVLLVMFLTLIGNARFRKEDTNLVQRVVSIFDPQYFRPFWASDPVGPAVVSTIECFNTSRSGVTFGSSYVENLLSMFPRSIWPDRPEGRSTGFAQEYAYERGEEYAEGTGFAYSAIAEAFRDFWYFGPLLLGFGCAWVSARITRASLSLGNISGRCLFALAVMFIVWNIPRNSMMVFLSPMFLLNYALAGLLLRACHPAKIHWLRSREPAFFLTADSVTPKPAD